MVIIFLEFRNEASISGLRMSPFPPSGFLALHTVDGQNPVLVARWLFGIAGVSFVSTSAKICLSEHDPSSFWRLASSQ